MKKILLIFFILNSHFYLFAQLGNPNNLTGNNTNENPFKETDEKKDEKKDIYDIKKHRYTDSMYVFKFFKLDGDQQHIDTSLSIKDYYELNVLSKDMFGFQQLSNIGQPLTILTYKKKDFSTIPEMGFDGRYIYYKKPNDITYFNVKSPISQIKYRSTFESGNILNAMFTANINKNLNFSVSYDGVRSVGNYIGTYFSKFNFTTTINYQSERYNSFFYFMNQSVLADENGGIQDFDVFINGNNDFSNKSTVPVNLSRNVTSFMRGQNYFLNHYFNLIYSDYFLLSIDHEFSFDDRYFSYKDTYDQKSKTYYGDFLSSQNTMSIDTTFYRNLNNDIGGKITIFKNEFKLLLNFNRIDYTFKSVTFFDNKLIDNLPISNNQFLKFEFTNNYFENVILKAKYIQGLNGDFSKSNSITFNGIIKLSDFILNANYQLENRYPNFTFFVFQSNYKDFNWKNNISKLENSKNLEFKLSYKNYNISVDYNSIKNHYYFDENRKFNIYENNIDILSGKISFPIKFWKFGIENDFIYQKVMQGSDIYRLPDFVTRNTLYFETDVSFIGEKKVLFFQTGFMFNMFSSYLANAYNPLYSNYYLQNNQKIGGFPMVDFFFNAKVRTMRIFINFQHINNLIFPQNRDYFSAPNQPYTDFTFRIGLIWNFFT